MLFNSNVFLFLFLPVVLSVYWLLSSLTLRKYWLVGASYVFYGAWSFKFALLMLATTGFDYFTAQHIEDAKRDSARRSWLILSLCANLGVLAVFKYYNFFVDSLHRILPFFGLPILNIVLPIGISFYTFESMSYVIDVYRRQTPAARRFIDYAHFITMFPRLVAGPIVRYSQMVEQLNTLPQRLSYEQAAMAAHFFIMGLSKKVLLADPLALHLVNPIFERAENPEFFAAWAAALGYAAQLYMDFSGYSDMAVGLGLLLGFQFPRNFHLPYRAPNIAEFWRRWHITLSTWLRDYLYIPLGGNRRGVSRTALNIFLTMFLGGLWHGANWTFALWGAYHGLFLIAHRAIHRSGATLRWKLPGAQVLSIACTFLSVVIGWVLFRTETPGAAFQMYGAMAGCKGLGLLWVREHLHLLLFLAGVLLIAFTVDTYECRPPLRRRYAVLEGLLLTACLTRLTAPSPFLYFQF